MAVVPNRDTSASVLASTGCWWYFVMSGWLCDSATAGAPNAYMAITAAQGGTFQYRSVAGTNTATPAFVTTIGGQPVAAPYYVKLVRVGNTYTGYVSKTSKTGPWTAVGSPTTLNNIGSTALVGLAVTSHDATKSVQSVFSEVTITQP